MKTKMEQRELLGLFLKDGTRTGFESSALTGDYVYFVRTESDGSDGYVMLDGKKYGTGKNSAISKDITIAGLSQAIGNYKNGDTISAGTSVQEILSNLLTKELWSEEPQIFETFTTSVEKPTIELKKGDVILTSASTLEVGDAVSIPEIAIGKSTCEQSYTISAFTYGYATKEDNSDKTSNVKYTKTFTPSESFISSAITESFKGFTDTNGKVLENRTDKSSLSGITVYVGEGQNSLTFNISGSTFTSQSAENITLYIETNLGNIYKKGSNELNKVEFTPTFDSSKMAAYSGVVTVNACYKAYTGFTPTNDDEGYKTIFTS